MQTRCYQKSEVESFLYTKDRNGVLSNMAITPFTVGVLSFKSSEHLYQALKFEDPVLQRRVLETATARDAKYLARSLPIREGWDGLRVNAMRATVQAKLANKVFHDTLLSTVRPIVEISYRDTFWGARPVGDTLVGFNVLGRLLMELRQRTRDYLPHRTFGFHIVDTAF